MSEVSQIALWVIVLAQTVVILGLMREVGLIQLRVGPAEAGGISDQGLPAGTEAPEISALTAEGIPVTLGGERGRPQLLVFASPSCGICHQMIGPIRVLARAEKQLDVFAICGADSDECIDFFKRKVDHFTLVADPSNDIKQAFHIPGSSFALMIDRVGTVCASGIVNNLPQLEHLLRTIDGRGDFISAAEMTGARPRVVAD